MTQNLEKTPVNINKFNTDEILQEILDNGYAQSTFFQNSVESVVSKQKFTDLSNLLLKIKNNQTEANVIVNNLVKLSNLTDELSNPLNFIGQVRSAIFGNDKFADTQDKIALVIESLLKSRDLLLEENQGIKISLLEIHEIATELEQYSVAAKEVKEKLEKVLPEISEKIQEVLQQVEIRKKDLEDIITLNIHSCRSLETVMSNNSEFIEIIDTEIGDAKRHMWEHLKNYKSDNLIAPNKEGGLMQKIKDNRGSKLGDDKKLKI